MPRKPRAKPQPKVGMKVGELEMVSMPDVMDSHMIKMTLGDKVIIIPHRTEEQLTTGIASAFRCLGIDHTNLSNIMVKTGKTPEEMEAAPLEPIEVYNARHSGNKTT